MEAKKIAKKDALPALVEFMASVIGRLKEEKRYASVHTYRSTKNSFMAYIVEEEKENAIERMEVLSTETIVRINEQMLSIDDKALVISSVFTPGRLKSYEGWLRQRGNKWNTVSTYMRTLRAVYNRIYTPGSFGHNPKLFDGVYTKVESLTKRALTIEQANILMAADLELLPKAVRSALAYSLLMLYFRGMPFIDLAYLRKQDLKGDYIVYCRHKTGRPIAVHIPREAQGLFEQFRDKNDSSTYLFPILDSRLKDDAAVYESYLQVLRCFNKRLQVVSKILFPTGVRLSSYTSRHTWATLAFHKGISIGIISKALGHSSIKVTETYLKPFEDHKVDAANEALLTSVANWNDRIIA